MPKQNSYPIIHRSEDNKILGGVCGGIGEYFNIDPNIIRLIFVLLTVFGGSGIIIYLILWVILPSKSQTGISDIKEKIHDFAHDMRNNGKNRNLVAYAAILLGIIFLLNNFGFSTFINIDRLWPLLLIFLGVSIIMRK